MIGSNVFLSIPYIIAQFRPMLTMSNPTSAVLHAHPASVSSRPAPVRVSVWRRVFDAWLLAYARVDAKGNLIDLA